MPEHWFELNTWLVAPFEFVKMVKREPVLLLPWTIFGTIAVVGMVWLISWVRHRRHQNFNPMQIGDYS